MKRKRRPGIFIPVALVLAIPLNAATLTSNHFSFGYGITSPGKKHLWDTTETKDANTELEPGFNLAINVESGTASLAGPTFVNRTLGEIKPSDVSGTAFDFEVTLTGGYSGPAPADAAANPNYRVEIVITSISIYAGATGEDESLNFNETTPGHPQFQEPQVVGENGLFNKRAAWNQIIWEPESFQSPVGELAQKQTRTFSLTENVPKRLVVDGFEISGKIVVTYDSKKN